MAELRYDDTNLQRLYAGLDEKNRKKVLRGSFTKAANTVRKAAISNLRSSIRSDKDMETGVRRIVFREKLGFRVTVGTKRKKGKQYGYHHNRQGLDKPVLIWAEDGTVRRKTKNRLGRKGHDTGQMKRYGFMVRAQSQTKDSVTADLHNALKDNVIKIAKKYGCK